MTYNEIRALRALGLKDNIIQALGKNIQGQSLALVAGSQTFTIPVPGTARVFLGIAAENSIILNTQWTLQLNNEIILDRVDTAFLEPVNGNQGALGYVELLRRLTGKDVLQLTATSAQSEAAQFTYWYLSGANVIV